jgi:hypothetical protein
MRCAAALPLHARCYDAVTAGQAPNPRPERLWTRKTHVRYLRGFRGGVWAVAMAPAGSWRVAGVVAGVAAGCFASFHCWLRSGHGRGSAGWAGRGRGGRASGGAAGAGGGGCGGGAAWPGWRGRCCGSWWRCWPWRRAGWCRMRRWWMGCGGGVVAGAGAEPAHARVGAAPGAGVRRAGAAPAWQASASWPMPSAAETRTMG